MDLALVIPPKLLEVYADKTDMFFVLAQFKEEPGYLDFFMTKPGRKWTILDNGASELGQTIDVTDYHYIALYFRPDEVVLPDYQHNPEATLEAHRASLAFWERRRSEGAWVPESFMLVPHGDSREEVVASTRDMLYLTAEHPSFPFSLGLPRILEEHTPRSRLFGGLHLLEVMLPDIHFLGSGPSLYDTMKDARRAGARSIDTGRPFRSKTLEEDTASVRSYVDDILTVFHA